MTQTQLSHTLHTSYVEIYLRVSKQKNKYCIQGKFRPRFIFALWPEGEFKTEPIELCMKDLIRKFEGGRIQDWANQSLILIGRK